MPRFIDTNIYIVQKPPSKETRCHTTVHYWRACEEIQTPVRNASNLFKNTHVQTRVPTEPNLQLPAWNSLVLHSTKRSLYRSRFNQWLLFLCFCFSFVLLHCFPVSNSYFFSVLYMSLNTNSLWRNFRSLGQILPQIDTLQLAGEKMPKLCLTMHITRIDLEPVKILMKTPNRLTCKFCKYC